jgi:hypothetical protein
MRMISADGNPKPKRDPAVAPNILDWADLADREPEPPAFLAVPLVPEDETTLLSGHGAVHKSRLCKQFAVACGLGLDIFGVPTQKRTVAYFSFEDGTKTLHRGCAAICKTHGKSLRDLEGRLFAFDGARSDSVIFSEKIDGYLAEL